MRSRHIGHSNGPGAPSPTLSIALDSSDKSGGAVPSVLARLGIEPRQTALVTKRQVCRVLLHEQGLRSSVSENRAISRAQWHQQSYTANHDARPMLIKRPAYIRGTRRDLPKSLLLINLSTKSSEMCYRNFIDLLSKHKITAPRPHSVFVEGKALKVVVQPGRMSRSCTKGRSG